MKSKMSMLLSRRCWPETRRGIHRLIADAATRDSAPTERLSDDQTTAIRVNIKQSTLSNH
jgi:hypothetical protein